MSIEAKIRKAETKDILINEYMELDEDDIKNGVQYKIVIRKLTVQKRYEIGSLASDSSNLPPWGALVQMLIDGVVSTPFNEWNEEKIKWLDGISPDLVSKIFTEVAEFNRPLAEESN